MSKLITQNDLQDILNEALPTPRYGGVQTASWTANSSSANNVKLTDSLHLVPGTYVITLKYPAVSANLYTTLFYSRGGGSNTLLDSFTVSQGISCSSHTYVINIPFELDLWAESATSTAITYTYKERGGLRAIQISESSVSDNEADYIVEQGESNGWTYRKWNSGKAECWYFDYTKASVSFSAWGGLYYADVATALSYPFTFENVPYNFITPYDSQAGVFGCWGTSTTGVGTVRVIHNTNNATTVRFHIYTVGTWK